MFTNWGSVTPFVLGSGRQFRPARPPPITSRAYARALNQVKSLGQDSSTTRTADETRLWYHPQWFARHIPDPDIGGQRLEHEFSAGELAPAGTSVREG